MQVKKSILTMSYKVYYFKQSRFTVKNLIIRTTYQMEVHNVYGARVIKTTFKNYISKQICQMLPPCTYILLLSKTHRNS